MENQEQLEQEEFQSLQLFQVPFKKARCKLFNRKTWSFWSIQVNERIRESISFALEHDTEACRMLEEEQHGHLIQVGLTKSWLFIF